MESFGVFGIMGFVIALIVLDRVTRLERTLRENNIRPGGRGNLDSQFRDKVGKTVAVTLYEEEGSTWCRILDVDEEWLHLLRNEGKKNQRELLVRLADVKQIKE